MPLRLSASERPLRNSEQGGHVPKLARRENGSNARRHGDQTRCNHLSDWMKALPGVLTGLAMVIGAVTALVRLFL